MMLHKFATIEEFAFASKGTKTVGLKRNAYIYVIKYKWKVQGLNIINNLASPFNF